MWQDVHVCSEIGNFIWIIKILHALRGNCLFIQWTVVVEMDGLVYWSSLLPILLAGFVGIVLFHYYTRSLCHNWKDVFIIFHMWHKNHFKVNIRNNNNGEGYKRGYSSTPPNRSVFTPVTMVSSWPTTSRRCPTIQLSISFLVMKLSHHSLLIPPTI